jgi:hypothetical protein
VALADTERQIVGDVLLPDGLEELVAVEAAPERKDGAEQVETMEDLGQLALGVDLPDAITSRTDRRGTHGGTRRPAGLAGGSRSAPRRI